MRIAVVLMPWQRRESPSPEVAMTVSILKSQNHEVLLWDINALMFSNVFKERKYWKHFLLEADSETIDNFQQDAREFFEYYANQILSSSPDIIVFKCIGKTYYNSIKMAGIIKEKNKDKIIILCGLLVTVSKDVELFVERQRDLPADFIICGEDEFALKEIVKAIETNTIDRLNVIFKKRDKVINCYNGPIIDNMDDLPFFDFSDFDLNLYRFSYALEIFISKGCPWRCAFCLDWKNERYRSMSGKRIFDEMMYQTKTHKDIRHIRLCDKTINGSVQSFKEFCDLTVDAISKGLIDVSKGWGWSGDAMIRPEMTKELLQLASKTRCIGIGYGLESGSEKVIKDMGKRFSISLAEEAIRNTHDAGIKTTINIMIGFPTETIKDFSKTMEFVKRNKEFIDEIRLTYDGCRIYPHSYLDTDTDKYHIVYPDHENKKLNSIDSGIDKAIYWKSGDGTNTYEERLRRAEEICQLILSLGIELRVNSRITKKAKVDQNA